MRVSVQPGRLHGSTAAPASKSHTIRALLVAAFAEGVSRIVAPLDATDTRACIAACRLLGARIEELRSGPGAPLQELRVGGVGGHPATPANVIDVVNSGTTLYLAAGLASVGEGWSVFTGDAQIRRRPIERLLQALGDLGATAFTTRAVDAPPVVLRGPLVGGSTKIECPTSQYLSSLLLAAPLTPRGATIEVSLLNERPYVEMTLRWLAEQGIDISCRDWRLFEVPGGHRYRAFERTIPGDFSSAAFLLCGAAITGSEIVVEGLDPQDTQGDRAILDILGSMGCRISIEAGGIRLGAPQGGRLRGGIFDLNALPDLLPILAVTACFGDRETRLTNISHARLKETDRIEVMRRELCKMGAQITATDDGLAIEPIERLRGVAVESHGDHRVAMALGIAGLAATGETEIAGAESAAFTFPDFFDILDVMVDKRQ